MKVSLNILNFVIPVLSITILILFSNIFLKFFPHDRIYYNIYISFFCFFILFLILFIKSKIEYNKLSKDNSFNQNSEISPLNNKQTLSEFIFGGIYIIIIGLSITSALETYGDIFDPNSENLSSIFNTPFKFLLILISYFLLAIPFFHAGAITLLKQLEITLTKKINYRLSVLVFFGLLVISGIFYFLSISLKNFILFCFIILIIMIVYSLWLIIQKAFLKKTEEEKYYLTNWLHLNMILSCFLIIIIHYYIIFYYHIFNEIETLLEISIPLLTLMILCRSLLDYLNCWNFYEKGFK